MNIYLTTSIQKKKRIKDWNEQIHHPGGKKFVFRSFKTHKSSILKELEIKIEEVT